MNKQEFNTFQPISENQLSIINPITRIDEEKLPKLFNDHLSSLSEAYTQYNNAEKKINDAREKVRQALENADERIKYAQNMPWHTARKRKIICAEYSTNKDEIKAIKENLKEIVDQIDDSAKTDKVIAEAMTPLVEAQTYLLQTENAQINYQNKLNEMINFLFGLNVYNIADRQTLLRQLKEMLEGASQEKIGELAEKEINSVLDQIAQSDNIRRELTENANILKKHKTILSDQQEKDREHDIKFVEIERVDEKQNEKIAQNAEKLLVHTKAIEQQKIKETEIENIAQNNFEKIDSLQKQVQLHSKIFDNELQRVKDTFESNIKETNISIRNLFDSVDKKSEEIYTDVVTLKETLQEEINNISHEFTEKIFKIYKEIENKSNEYILKIAENENTLEVHKTILSEQQEKDREHDIKFVEIEKADEEQNEKIAENAEKLLEHTKAIEQQKIKNTEIECIAQNNFKKIDSLQKDVHERAVTFDTELQNLKTAFENDIEKTYISIKNLSDLLIEKSNEINADIIVLKETFQKEAENITQEFNEKILKVNTDIKNKSEQMSNKIDELNCRGNKLQYIMGKNGWKNRNASYCTRNLNF